MPQKSASSSSSSSEEDLAAFRAVVVSFEEITSKQKEVAEQAKQRIAGAIKRKRYVGRKIAAAEEDGANGVKDNGADDDDGPWDQLDPVQLKVAAALDSLLEGRLKLKAPGPKTLRREARAAGRALEKADADAGGVFRFFARVKPGEPAALEPYEASPPKGTPFPELFRLRRNPAAAEAAAALPMLAVDGAALLTAAAKASTAAAAAMGLVIEQPGQQKQKQKQQKTHRHLQEGVVVDPRISIPHDERIQRLVGGSFKTRLAC
ncbi:hypothetical protein Vretimale_3228 [Volvox reticuliferus]|uniref:Uncharacterized protein n=1 Tax=Volvox reticuliferus TaxID=1737510 RepID=A0A8J4DBB2_9CHLO|nr:hypothetical protein Vretifemale_6617 [Volvox reticuliferus]GIL97637.1 hypothetical protein Vretimale_3228 [Volvox reticuliferus]